MQRSGDMFLGKVLRSQLFYLGHDRFRAIKAQQSTMRSSRRQMNLLLTTGVPDRHALSCTNARVASENGREKDSVVDCPSGPGVTGTVTVDARGSAESL
ncbi:hypothetical protein BZM27_34535 [Paraburkholderia steynii]|uniref:Uncharacterized protein n=1 Tax=Paraburkholderia steynii TaxID=1245441 RepID=A0A4R0X8R0_9BURK|nr:hypothetical protein BZM27_34535 [Paraburkholderia steynii]